MNILQTGLSSLQTDIDYLRPNVSILQSTVTTSQVNISSLQTDMDYLRPNVSTLQSTVNTLQNDVSRLQPNRERGDD